MTMFLSLGPLVLAGSKLSPRLWNFQGTRLSLRRVVFVRFQAWLTLSVAFWEF